MSAPLPVVLDLPPPFSSATGSLRTIRCSRAVLLLSFPEEYFASHAKHIWHNSESVNINFSNIGEILKDTLNIRHWVGRIEGFQ